MPIHNYSLDGAKLFRVIVSKRIGGKLKTLKCSGLRSRSEAERTQEKLTTELQIAHAKSLNKAHRWSTLVNEYDQILSRRVKFSTYQARCSTLKRHTSSWNDDLITDVTVTRVDQLLQALLKTKSLGTVINLKKGLNGTFELALAKGILNYNPMKMLSPLPRRQQTKLEAMTKSEVQKLLTASVAQEHPWAIIWQTVYLTGLRSGEALALQVQDLNFENDRISITKSYCSKSRCLSKTKTGESRTIPMNSKLRSLLLSACEGKSKDDFVLPQLSAWKKGEAARYLKAFQTELGIRKTNFHSLRASHITHLLLDGVAMIKVQALAGHRDIKTTMHYVRLVAEDLVGSTESLSYSSFCTKQSALLDLPAPE